MARSVSQGACMLSRGTISSRCCYEIFDGIDPITRISEDRGFVKVFVQVLMRHCRDGGGKRVDGATPKSSGYGIFELDANHSDKSIVMNRQPEVFADVSFVLSYGARENAFTLKYKTRSPANFSASYHLFLTRSFHRVDVPLAAFGFALPRSAPASPLLVAGVSLLL
ncbi:18755_t:CDS:2 [Acaulospora morrowiae]|uniref:18755_t:CDS:1 n=1 Tax=Acaulospora morrowiae TaxID=94023 RepID=A0A9N9CIB6_9GLOM|nr:18755_t:CDS:2 [Acaulospora morrowiae]